MSIPLQPSYHNRFSQHTSFIRIKLATMRRHNTAPKLINISNRVFILLTLHPIGKIE